MTMTKQDRICMISLFAVMLVLMGVPALCLSTNTVVDELGTLTNTALLTGRNWGNIPAKTRIMRPQSKARK